MNAADGIARVLRYDEWRHHLNVGNVFLACGAALAIVAGFSYCQGKSTGEAIARESAIAVMRLAIADSSKVIEARVDARYQAIAFQDKAVAAARDLHTTSRDKIRVVSDTVLSVVRATDTVRVDVPVEVVRAIQASDTLIARQDSLMALLRVQLADVTKDRDVWQHRALLDESAYSKARPRFGIRTGVALGILATISFVKLAR